MPYLVHEGGILLDIRDYSIDGTFKAAMLDEFARQEDDYLAALSAALQPPQPPHGALQGDMVTKALKIVDEYSTVTRRRHVLLHARLRMEIPGCDPSTILDYAYAVRRLQSRFASTIADFSRAQLQSVAHMHTQAIAIAKAKELQEYSTDSLAARIAAADIAHAAVHEWRVLRAKQFEDNAARDAAEAAAARLAVENEHERRDHERELAQSVRARAQSAAAALRAAEEQKMRELQVIADRERRVQLAHGKIKADARNAAAVEEKARRRRERIEAEQAEELAAAQRLEALRRLVRDKLTTARDPARLKRLTKARQAALEAPHDPTYFQVHGYEDNRIFNDPRARLLELLGQSRAPSEGRFVSRSTQQYVASKMFALRPVLGFAREIQSQIRLGEDT
ncbi:hypothetical protein BC828DRAFT_248094 [Blastocladiella britannica]|nr:hypothetical protein BC828DRAFT_248094 [Blastocladiella britannica]